MEYINSWLSYGGRIPWDYMYKIYTLTYEANRTHCISMSKIRADHLVVSGRFG